MILEVDNIVNKTLISMCNLVCETALYEQVLLKATVSILTALLLGHSKFFQCLASADGLVLNYEK
jgi:hypothetical protein